MRMHVRVYMFECVCVYMFECVCVCESDRKRERE
jgi:hypothetical protein